MCAINFYLSFLKSNSELLWHLKRCPQRIIITYKLLLNLCVSNFVSFFLLNVFYFFKADKEFVWSLWKRLQVTNPDVTQAVSLVVERWVTKFFFYWYFIYRIYFFSLLKLTLSVNLLKRFIWFPEESSAWCYSYLTYFKVCQFAKYS